MLNTYAPRQMPTIWKLGLSAAVLLATTSLFLGDHLLASGRNIALSVLPAALFLGLTFFFHRNERLRRFWEVAFAFFCGSFGLVLAWVLPTDYLRVLGASTSTAQGVAVLKFFELLPVALSILVLTWLAQGSLDPIYLKRGNLRSGVGLGLLLGIAALVGYLLISWSRIDPEKASRALPWLIAFALSNAFFEELLIRALFLKRLIALLGTRWGVVLSALCYGLFFLGVQSAVGPTPYAALVVIFPLGLLYGFIMQNADSIWGPVSLHAALDLIFLLGVFASR